jgi:hypothetical protein
MLVLFYILVEIFRQRFRLTLPSADHVPQYGTLLIEDSALSPAGELMALQLLPGLLVGDAVG